MNGTLYLIPTTLGNTPENNTLPEYTLSILRKLDVLMVENLRSATSFYNGWATPSPSTRSISIPLIKIPLTRKFTLS